MAQAGGLTRQGAVADAYETARLSAELHDEHGWPGKCPWDGLHDLLAAVEARDVQCLALEQADDEDFGNLRRGAWRSTSESGPC